MYDTNPGTRPCRGDCELHRRDFEIRAGVGGILAEVKDYKILSIHKLDRGGGFPSIAGSAASIWIRSQNREGNVRLKNIYLI